MNLLSKFFKWISDSSDNPKSEQNAYLVKHGSDSCCPTCRVWESQGNEITTEALSDGSDKRTCGKCGYQWRAIFTPAGFVSIEVDAPLKQDKG